MIAALAAVVRGRWSRGLLTACWVLAALTFPGSASSQDEEAPVPLTTIRFVHAVPEAPNVQIRVDGTPLFDDVAFGRATEYTTIQPGDRDIAVVPAGSGDSPLAETSAAIDEGSSYVVTVLGQVGDVNIKVNEVKLEGLGFGKARVRLIDASPDAGEIDVAIQGADNLFENVDFEEDTDYKEIDAGSFGLELRYGDDGASVTGFALDAQTGRVYDLVAVGLAGNQTLNVLTLVTIVSPPCSEILGIGTAGDACVRVVHAQPDLGPADAAIAGNVVVRGLSYGEASEFVPVPAGEELPITVTSGGREFAGDGRVPTGSFEAGRAYEVIAWTLDDEPMSPDTAAVEIGVFSIDLAPLPADQGRVRLINVVADGDELDVVIPANSDDPELVGGVGDGHASPYEVLDAGDHEIELHLEGEEGSVFGTTLDVESGIVYDLVAHGRLAGDAFKLLVLTVPAQIRSDAATPALSEPGATPAG